MNLPTNHQAGTSWSATIQDPNTNEEIKSGSHLPELEGTYVDTVQIDSWLHVAALTEDTYWVRVGPLHLSVQVGKAGEAKAVRIETEPSNHSEDCVVYHDAADYTVKIRASGYQTGYS